MKNLKITSTSTQRQDSTVCTVTKEYISKSSLSVISHRWDQLVVLSASTPSIPNCIFIYFARSHIFLLIISDHFFICSTPSLPVSLYSDFTRLLDHWPLFIFLTNVQNHFNLFFFLFLCVTPKLFCLCIHA